MSSEKTRNSSFELMRIISMFMIVVWHFLCHGGIIGSSYGVPNLIFKLIEALLFVHVNSFVLLSGYFECEKKMHLGKAIKLNNMVWFYSSIIFLILIFTGNIIVESNVDVLKQLLPISFYDYWFFSTYLILYLISPLLNTIINNSDKKRMKLIIGLLFILECVLPILTKNAFYNTGNGYSLYHFIFLYFVGSYFKKYPIDKNYLFSYFKKNAQRLLLIGIMIFIALIRFMFYYFGSKAIYMNDDFIRDIGYTFINSFEAYNSPLLVVQSICYFLLFTTCDFNNNFINKVASNVFAIYLITDNKYFSSIMYKFLGFTKAKYDLSILGKVLLFALSIFIICELIESLRKLVFKLLYNTKLAKKNRTWYQSYIKSLGIDINW